jgi:single-strand DNA-binding protein
MAKSLNQVELIGYLGGDVDMRYTQQGTAVGSVNIATTRGVKRGEVWEDETEWTPLVVWDKSAENLTKYAGKGSRIYVKGRLQTRNWEDKDSGQKRYKTEVVVDDFILLDSKGSNDTDSAASAPQNGAQQATRQTNERGTTSANASRSNGRNVPQRDEDLPF